MRTLKFHNIDEFEKWVSQGNEIYSIRDTDSEDKYGEYLFDVDDDGYNDLIDVEHVIDTNGYTDMHSLIPLTDERKAELAEKYGIKIEIENK